MRKWLYSITSNIKHHFVKDVIILQAGTTVGTVLSFAASLAMARVFKPELYGQYVLIFSLLGLVGLFMNWGTGEASVTLLAEAYNRKERQDILNIIAYNLKISILVFLIVGLLGFILAPFLAQILYHQEIIGHWSRVFFLTNFILMFYAFLLFILRVIRQIAKYTILENLNNFLTSLAIITVLSLGLGVWGVVYVQLLVAVLFFIISYFWYRSLQKKEALLPTWREIIQAIFKVKVRKYFKFGLQIAIDKNLSNFRSLLPTLLMGYLLVSSDIAFYRIAFSYTALTGLLISPIAGLLAVQFPRTKVFGTESLKKRFIQTSVVGGTISVYLALFLVILAPFLIKLFYGTEYLPSIGLVYILAFNFALSGFAMGLGSIYRTIQKMKVSIIINAVSVIISLPLAWWLVKTYGVLGAAWWLVIVNNLLMIIGWCYLMNYFHKKINQASVNK